MVSIGIIDELKKILHVPSKCDILNSEFMKDIDLLNKSISSITPTCDTLNDNIMYACIHFEDKSRLNITFEHFEELAQKDLVSADNLEHLEEAKGYWCRIMTAINEGGVLVL